MIVQSTAETPIKIIEITVNKFLREQTSYTIY